MFIMQSCLTLSVHGTLDAQRHLREESSLDGASSGTTDLRLANDLSWTLILGH